MKVEEGFQQEVYSLPEDGYAASRSLRALLRRMLPSEVLTTVEADLHRFAKRLHGDIADIGRLADGSMNEPRLVQYDHYGQRIDRLETSEGWRRLKGIAAEEGLVGIPYERESAEFSRVHVFVKSYLWVGDARMVGCPLSMTDGAARVIELYGTSQMKAEVYPRLISRDPKKAWTAGQFMTEKPGGQSSLVLFGSGSDVSRTETTAVRAPGQSDHVQPGDAYILDGFKWFSSATDGDVALSLARTGPEGSRSAGLSVFLLPLKSELMTPDSPRSPNGVYVHRLKNKVGTKPVPTAELSICGARGYLIGDIGAGVRTIATVLNITRMHSAIHSLGSIGRALSIATAYAGVRRVLDHRQKEYILLKDLPLHTAFLSNIALLHHALLHLIIPVTHLLGLSETAKSTPQEKSRLRLLTPVVKAYAGAKAAGAVEDCIEALGGLGYMDEEGLGRLARDVLVERIWEGTPNVLALDLCRVIVKSKHKAMDHYFEWAESILSSTSSDPSIHVLRDALLLIRRSTTSLLQESRTMDPRLPRPLLDLVAHSTAALEMLAQANWASKTKGEDPESEWEAFSRWIEIGQTERHAVARLLDNDDAAWKRELELQNDFVYGRDRAKL